MSGQPRTERLALRITRERVVRWARAWIKMTAQARGGRILWVIFVLSLPLTTPLLRGDGNAYYAYLPTLFIDGDLEFANQYANADPKFLQNAGNWERSATGLTVNKWPPGAALFWSPFFVAGHLVTIGMRALGFALPADGYALPNLWATALASVSYGFLGLWLSYRVALRFVAERAAVLAVLAIWFASSVPVYMYFLPFTAHAVALFTTALFVWYWLSLPPRCDDARQVALGVIGGCCAVVRYECAVVLLIAFADLALAAWERSARARVLARSAGALVAGAALGLLPLLATRALIYGDPVNTGYETELAGHDWLHPRFVQLFFTSAHGAFSWTPVLLFATIGFVMFAYRRPRLGIPLALPFAVLSYVTACWWGTEMSSYGNRFFVSYSVFFVVGAAVLIDALLRVVSLRMLATGAGALVAWNVLLIGQFGLGMVPRDSTMMERFSWRATVRNQLEVPARLAREAGDFVGDRRRFMERIGELEREQRARGGQL